MWSLRLEFRCKIPAHVRGLVPKAVPCDKSLRLVFGSKHWLTAYMHRNCTPNKIKTVLKLIRKFLSWNSFPKRVANLLIDRLTTNAQNKVLNHVTNDTSHNNQQSTVWLTIPFVGDLTTQLLRSLNVSFAGRCLADSNVDICIRIKEKTTKLFLYKH